MKIFLDSGLLNVLSLCSSLRETGGGKREFLARSVPFDEFIP